MERVKLALVGAGHRGRKIYGKHIKEYFPQIEITALAETDQGRREAFAAEHGLAPQAVFPSWEEMAERPKLADGVIVATSDRGHYEPTIAFLNRGYHVLCEKPMAPDPLQCLRMQEAAEENGKMLAISHVLRYTSFYGKVKELLEAGAVGRVMSIQYNENVGIDHYMHSYVRGTWRNEKVAANMLLAKCCHDTDILAWITGKKCRRVYSAGELSFFHEGNAPEGSTARCTDGCPVEKECLYSALKAYLRRGEELDLATHDEWVRSISFVIGAGEDTSTEARIEALKTGPFGKCAFRCDNDVVDHQVAVFEMEDDITVAFTMCGFTAKGGRTFKIMGTRGEMHCCMAGNEITINSFDGSERTINPAEPVGGHGGGDHGIIAAFAESILHADPSRIITSGRDSVHSHIMVFAAEESRKTGKSVDIDEYVSRLSRPVPA